MLAYCNCTFFCTFSTARHCTSTYWASNMQLSWICKIPKSSIVFLIFLLTCISIFCTFVLCSFYGISVVHFQNWPVHNRPFVTDHVHSRPIHKEQPTQSVCYECETPFPFPHQIISCCCCGNAFLFGVGTPFPICMSRICMSLARLWDRSHVSI